jgi:hypothetical protein
MLDYGERCEAAACLEAHSGGAGEETGAQRRAPRCLGALGGYGGGGRAGSRGSRGSDDHEACASARITGGLKQPVIPTLASLLCEGPPILVVFLYTSQPEFWGWHPTTHRRSPGRIAAEVQSGAA